MPARVPLKIFKLVQTKTGTFDLAPTQYAQGVTTNDIITLTDGDRVINVGQLPVGLPLSIPVPSLVQSDASGDFVVNGSDKLYIKPSNPNALGPQSNPSVFEFYVNPQRLVPTYSKIQTEIRTRGGWEIQHWGNALTELTIEGHSGGMHRRNETGQVMRTQGDATSTAQNAIQGVSGDGLTDTQDITDSTAWKRLLQLKNLFDADHAKRNQEQLTLLGLSIYNSFYIGYFVTFSGPIQEADKPYIFSYTFTMKILQESTVNTLAPSLVDMARAGTIIGSQRDFI